MKLQKINKIILGFSLVIPIFLIVRLLSYESLSEIESTVGLVIHTHQVIEKLDDILSHAKDAETGTRGFVITGDTVYLEPYNNAISRLGQEMHDLRNLLSDSPIQQHNTDTLQTLINEKLAILKDGITRRSHGGFDSVAPLTRSGRGNILMQDIRDLIARMKLHEDGLLLTRNGAVRNEVDRNRIFVIVGLIIGLGLIIAAVIFLQIDIKKRTQAEAALQQSEERYRAMIDDAGDIIYRTDVGAKIIFCNPTAIRITGYAENELIGKHYLEIIHPDEREATQQFYARQRQEKIPNTYYEFPILTKNGEKRWLGQNLQVILRNGSIDGFQAVARDITAIKQAEQALQESEARFRGIFEHTPIGMAVLSLHGKFLQVNQAMEDLVGYTAEELYAMPSITSITHPDDIAVSTDVLSGVSERRLPSASFEKRYIHKYGNTIWVSVNSAPVNDTEGKPLYVIGQVQDITFRKKTAEEIQILNKQLAEKINLLENANKDLEAFSSSVSHDLRSPLQSVMGFAFLLRETAEGKLNDQEKEFLTNIETSGTRMQEIIEDMLTLAHTTQNEFKAECVELSTLVHNVAKNLHESQPERNVEFVIQDNVTVKGDKRLLRILMENLIGNSWKYSSKHPTARIEFGEMPHNGNTQTIFIRDDGAGFDMKHADIMFDPFRRLHQSKDFPGTGVGLAIVQRIVQRHGGAIRAEGAVEKGAAFYVTLPNEGK